MQPYFFPYIGYFQLIHSADLFIVYDQIKYTKKGWINRNRMLQNGKGVLFSLPLKDASDSLDVCDRLLATDFDRDRFLRQIRGAYRNATFFSETFPLVEQIMRYNERNLFSFLHHAIAKICQHLEISTEIRVSSDIAVEEGLKNHQKVIALCKAVGADTYVNAIGGMELYTRDKFRSCGLGLNFIKSNFYAYRQLGDAFVPGLSIIDVMMFNSLETIKSQALLQYELI